MRDIHNYLTKAKKIANQIEEIHKNIKYENIEYDLKNPKVITGRLFAQFNKQRTIINLQDAEFQVFSQWGDDGIIQYLIDAVQVENETFIEFGVENYKESNTRFLLINNNWSGMVIDASEKNINYIKSDPISWAHELYALNEFITKENINSILERFLNLGYHKEIGILSIDIDGNDYWIWNEINSINPIIVIVEYNSLFGIDNPWTIEYKSDFFRLDPGNSILHYGTSLLSLCDLAEKKDYAFIGCNSAGNNAYFVRLDRIRNLKALTPKEGFVLSKFRELVLPGGSRISGTERVNYIKGKKVYNTRTEQIEII